MKKFWNWIKNSDDTRILRLEGPIDEESFWGDEITPQMFRDELESGEGDVTVWINSPGGNVFAAAEIYTMLKDYKGSITVKIDAIAASAASVVAMAGDTVQMSPVAMLMIHDPSTVAMGNTKDMEKAIEVLEEVKESIINAYAAKSGLTHALSVGEDSEGGFTVPDEFEKKLVEALEENNIFRGMATVIRTSSGTRKIPIAEDTGEASWIDEGEEIPESDTTFGQTMLSAYKLGTMIKISNELLNDSAFDLATYIARRFGVRMGNAEERAFITGDGVGKPLGLLAEAGGAKVGVTAAQKDAVSFDEIFKLYYALKAPYRKKAQFLCNEALVLQLMTIKDNNGNYIWKPGLEIGKPDTLLNRPLKTSAFMPEIKGGSKVMAFGDYSYYWVADRQNRTFRRLNELYARTDQVGFLTTQRVDGKLILPEAVQLLQMAPQG